jgi:hypothetical protein
MLYFGKLKGAFMPLLWIRIGYPDPALNLSADPDPDTGSQTDADPCGSGYSSDKELNFYMKNIVM